MIKAPLSREDDAALACTLPLLRGSWFLTPRGGPGPAPTEAHSRQCTCRGLDQSGEGAQLLRQGQEDLILIIDGICRTRQTGLQSRPTADFPWGTSVLQSFLNLAATLYLGGQRWQGWERGGTGDQVCDARGRGHQYCQVQSQRDLIDILSHFLTT